MAETQGLPPVRPQYLLEGAGYALEQCGLLSRDANLLYQNRAYRRGVARAWGSPSRGRAELATEYHAKLFAHELTRQRSVADAEKLAGAAERHSEYQDSNQEKSEPPISSASSSRTDQGCAASLLPDRRKTSCNARMLELHARNCGQRYGSAANRSRMVVFAIDGL